MFVRIYDAKHPTDGVNDRTQVDRFIAGVTLLFLYCCSKIDSLFLSVILQWQNSWASEAVLLTLTASAT